MGEGVPYGRRLTELAAQFGQDTALIFAADDGVDTTYSWSVLEARANQVARGLAAAGVGPDELVVVGLGSRPEHIIATFAAWKLGASVLPIRADLPPWERERLLATAQPRAVIGDWEDPAADTIIPSDLDKTDLLDDSTFGGDRAPAYSRLVASSGSTGTPKIIISPSPGTYLSDDRGSVAGLIPTKSVVLSVSPLYHTNGYAFCYPPLLDGSQVVLMEHFEAARAVDLIERYHVTTTVLVPAMLQRIARLPDIAERDFSSIQQIVYGGAVLPDWAARVWLDLIPPERFLLTYGGSEAIGLCVGTGRDWLTHPGTTGRAVDCDLVILGVDRRPVPTGEVGEVWMRAHSGGEPFRYVGMPTPEPTLEGFRTYGDMGRVDEDGFLYIADRRTDMIVTGGVNVFPAEVEVALSEHPEVVDVVVIGVPDPEWGRRVYAIVEPRDPDAPPSDEDLRAYCKSRLSGPKVPKDFEIVSQLPRTAAGKINRSRLAAERA